MFLLLRPAEADYFAEEPAKFAESPEDQWMHSRKFERSQA